MMNASNDFIKVSAKEFGSKFSDKKECWKFIVTEYKGYLPDYKL